MELGTYNKLRFLIMQCLEDLDKKSLRIFLIRYREVFREIENTNAAIYLFKKKRKRVLTKYGLRFKNTSGREIQWLMLQYQKRLNLCLRLYDKLMHYKYHGIGQDI